MDIQEIIRRLRAGQSNRAIHEDLGVHRNTVKKYRQWAEERRAVLMLASDHGFEWSEGRPTTVSSHDRETAARASRQGVEARELLFAVDELHMQQSIILGCI